MPESDDKLWQIDLFGALQIRDPAGESRPLASRKAGELVAFLAMRRSPMVERDAVAQTLWPEADVMTARNRLKATLSIIRRAVVGIPILAHGKRYLELPREAVVIDYEVCERRLKWRRALTGRNRAAFAKQLLEITKRGLLPDSNAPWVVGERNRYAALGQELEQDLETGDPAVEPRFRLDDQLGGVDVPLVGRSSELRQIQEWLAGQGRQKLYLVGMPGVGKSRLLREVLQSLSSDCDALVALSTVQTSETPWLDRLGQALGVQRSEDVSTALAQLLGDFRRPLLLLDDVDQASGEMLAWVEHIMAIVPNLKLLGTARRRPTEPGAAICELATLSQQGRKGGEAIDLLIRFARHFGVSERSIHDGREALEQIAERLDGLPLALEIAAAWLPVVDPRSLNVKLEKSLDLVTRQAGAGRGSLVDCVSVICEDLMPEDRDALARLCACRGGFGEALAEEMLGPDWVWRIRTLVDRSLALRIDGHMENRFLVVQALREAVRTVEPGDRVARADAAWRTACFSLCEKARFEIDEGDRRRWLLWLRDEGENLIAAFSERTGGKTALREAIRRWSRCRSSFWLIGQSREFRRVLTELLEAGEKAFPGNGSSTPSAIVFRRVDSLIDQHKIEEAIRMAASHRRALEAAGETLDLARALDDEGDVRELANDFEGSAECWNRCSALFEQAGYRRHAVWIEAKLAGAETHLGRFADSLARKKRTVARARAVGDDNSVGMYLKEFAASAIENRGFAEGIRLAKASVAEFRKTGEMVTLSRSLLVLAAAYLASNAYVEAARALEEAQQLDPYPDFYHQERLDILKRFHAGKADGRLFYDHLTIET